MRWPLAWTGPLPDGAPVVGWTLRLLGAVAALGLALAVVGLVVGIRILTGGSSDGWADLAGALSLVLGAVLGILAGALSVGVHLAYRAPDAARHRRVRVLAWTLIAVAVAYAPVYARDVLAGHVTPLSGYALVLFTLSGLAGVVLLWAVRPGRP